MQTTQEEKSSMERPKVKNFLLNPDNKGLMTYISIFNPSLIVFWENNDVCYYCLQNNFLQGLLG